MHVGCPCQSTLLTGVRRVPLDRRFGIRSIPPPRRTTVCATLAFVERFALFSVATFDKLPRKALPKTFEAHIFESNWAHRRLSFWMATLGTVTAVVLADAACGRPPPAARAAPTDDAYRRP